MTFFHSKSFIIKNYFFNKGIKRSKTAYLNKACTCKKLRIQLALASPIILPNGTKFIFINRLSYYDTILFINSKPPTVEQLATITNELKISGQFLCPMLIWATKDGVPTIVLVKPGSKKSNKIVKTPPVYGLAYSICILSDEQED